MGDGESFGCHATAHGSEKFNLLAPADASQPSIPGDAKREEEGMCYSCHDADGPASTNIQAQFNLSHRHNVSLLDQNDGSKVECRNCHNPHVSSSAKPLIGPDSASGSPWNGSGEAFCLTCHDGSPPASVSFPANSAGTGHDKSQFTGTKHETELGDASCQRCHEPHGSFNISLLKENYVIRDNNTYATRDYQTCWNCHNENAIIKQKNAFKKLHEKHVKKEDTPCIMCHDAHGPHDKGELGLINFDFALQNGFDIQLIGGRNSSTAFWISGDKGYCYLRCHGKDHKPKSYKRFGKGGD